MQRRLFRDLCWFRMGSYRVRSSSEVELYLSLPFRAAQGYADDRSEGDEVRRGSKVQMKNISADSRNTHFVVHTSVHTYEYVLVRFREIFADFQKARVLELYLGVANNA